MHQRGSAISFLEGFELGLEFLGVGVQLEGSLLQPGHALVDLKQGPMLRNIWVKKTGKLFVKLF
jgi:hypothetical protein